MHDRSSFAKLLPLFGALTLSLVGRVASGEEEPPAVEVDESELARLLAPENPVEIQIVKAVSIPRTKGRLAVLYRYAGEKHWQHEQRRSGTLGSAIAVIEEAEGRCDEEGGSTDAIDACYVEAAPDPFVGWTRYGLKVFSWKVAIVNPRKGAKGVVATKELWRLAAKGNASSSLSPELRVSDLDLDKRLEVTATIVLGLPDTDSFYEETVGATFVLDAADLREQFAMIREHRGEGGDVSMVSEHLEAVYRANDEDGDGHPELLVNGKNRRTHEDPTDGEHGGTYKRASRIGPLTCPYDVESDSWRCPGKGGTLSSRPPVAGHLWRAATPPPRRSRPLPPPTAPRAPPRPGHNGPDEEEAPEAAPTKTPPPPRCKIVVHDPESPLNVRSGPATRHPVVATIAHGREVQPAERRGRWMRIMRPAVGWIWAPNTREICGD